MQHNRFSACLYDIRNGFVRAFFIIFISHHYFCPFLGQKFSGFLSDPAGRTCDNRYFSFQYHIKISYKQTKLAIASPSRSFIMRTPWVERDWVLISSKPVRMTCPFLDMTTISSSPPSPRVMMREVMSGPVLGVDCMVLMPEPP